MMQLPADWRRENWRDLPSNPVVNFVAGDGVRTAVGDPTVLTPGQFDEQWHLFCHGFPCDTYFPYLFHFTSDDGEKWSLLRKQPMNVNPTYLFRDRSKWILYFSVSLFMEPGAREKYGASNIVRAIWSDDLEHWSKPIDVQLPTLDWEREHSLYMPDCVQLRNPCMIRLPNGRYRLYYSAGTVKLHDCGYEEPKYISFAEGPTPFGPFEKYGQPIIVPDPKLPHRNYGAGAIKVFGCGDGYLGLYNSIYVDEKGCSRSAINLIVSDDGIRWTEADYNPIILPTDDGGWKSTLVYQLDLVRSGDELRLYYNSRCGTSDGVETIGCSVLKTDLNVEKLWG